jgi:hypothetical protein
MTEAVYEMVPRHRRRGPTATGADADRQQSARDRADSRDRVGPAYEVDECAGRCLYRGTDLELACEIHDVNPSARLSRCDAAPRTGHEPAEDPTRQGTVR